MMLSTPLVASARRSDFRRQQSMTKLRSDTRALVRTGIDGVCAARVGRITVRVKDRFGCVPFA
jgi:hypothetical protein